MDRKEKLGIAVKTERLRRNMTQTELSQKAGVSLRTITDVEKYRGNRAMILCTNSSDI